MTFPDIKGEREAFYTNLAHVEYRKVHANEIAEQNKKIEVARETYLPPVNYYQRGVIEFFVKTFEDKETQENMELAGGVRSLEDMDFGATYELIYYKMPQNQFL